VVSVLSLIITGADGSVSALLCEHHQVQARDCGMDRMSHDKPEPNGEEQPFLDAQNGQRTHDSGAKSHAGRRALGMIRFGVEVAMAAAIVLLLAERLSCTPCRKPIRKSPVPDCTCVQMINYLGLMC
jgi:hypothetical protein